MNPVFIILLFLAGGLLWLLLSGLYRFIGKIAGRLVDDAKEAMFDEKEESEKENEEK